MAQPLDPRVHNMLKERYYDSKGVLSIPLNLEKFRKKLAKEFPEIVPKLSEILQR